MPLTSHHRGIFWIILAGFWAPFMYVCLRNASEELPFILVASLTDILALPLIALWARPHLLPTRKVPIKLYFLRGVLGYTCFLLTIYGLTLIPLTSVTVLEFSCPLIASLLAVVFLRERMTRHKSLTLLAGFIGVLIVVRPGSTVFHYGSLVILLASILWAVVIILIRHLSARDDHKTITFYSMLAVVACCIPFAIALWQPPSLTAWSWLIAAALGSTMLVISFTRAYAETEISLLMPFEFCELIFATIMGYLFFRELPDIWVYIGGSVIFLSAAYLVHRSRHHPQTTPPPAS